MTTNAKVWLISGASRGIGLALADKILASGERVALLARGESVHKLAAERGENCIACQADVGNAQQVQTAIEQITEHWQRVDVVVNNAGVHRGGKISRLENDDWEQVLNTNVTGAMNTVRAASPHLQEGAAIVNVGAVVGFRGFPGDVAYAASKAGLAGFTRALAIEFAERAITVNLVIPGLVLTEMTQGLSSKALQSMQDMIPLGRYGNADEVAEVIEWVARSPYMTGAFVPVDGGLLSTFGMPG
ncbi:MAG: SDR family oxidoreductase [Pseudomonadales bacterium]